MTELVRYVAGMTCQHCVRAISSQVRDVPGVQTVEVSLSASSVVVRGMGAISPEEVEAAIVEAGYEIAHGPSCAGCRPDEDRSR
jgi:copper chaperone